MEAITVRTSTRFTLAQPCNRRFLAWILPVLLFLPLPGKSFPDTSETPGAGARPQADADTFVRDVLHNEVEAQIHDKALWTYREHRVEEGQEKLLIVCQTREGEIERLVAINGKPLSRKEAQAEDGRIQNLVSHPGQMRQKQKKQHEDAEQARNLLKIFPDAFRFQYDGTEGSLVRLKFTPNPQFHPSGRAEQVFHFLEGTLLLDGRARRLAAIKGKLTREVKFGGGLLGHLARGGTFSVEQQEVDSGYWETTLLRVQMNGKALFFKTIAVQDDETYADFRRVPENTGLQRAAELLNRDDVNHSAYLK
jgi:hypothetical protein